MHTSDGKRWSIIQIVAIWCPFWVYYMRCKKKVINDAKKWNNDSQKDSRVDAFWFLWFSCTMLNGHFYENFIMKDIQESVQKNFGTWNTFSKDENLSMWSSNIELFLENLDSKWVFEAFERSFDIINWTVLNEPKW